MVTSKEGEGDVEMREMTPLAMVAEVEQEASDMEVESKEEFEAAPATIKEDKEEERAKEVEETWSNTPLRQVGDNKLEWLDSDKRVAGVEWQFQRELEAAGEELLAAQAHYTVTK
ncbi:hypothetical protein J132_00289 [Termitomyces sp. J132]|nr:hypothetical protein J132_00289 [Termitomyces sp. J132]